MRQLGGDAVTSSEEHEAWTAPDPLGLAAGDPDFYGYCMDDPVKLVDTLGLESGKFIAGWARDQVENHPLRFAPYTPAQRLLGPVAGRIAEVASPLPTFGYNLVFDEYQRCNEFTCTALTEGNPLLEKMPPDPSDSSRPYWLVEDFAKEENTRDRFMRFTDKDKLRDGDVFIYHDKDLGRHHSGIYLGDGEVAYGGPDGSKFNTLDQLDSEFGMTPFFLRPSMGGKRKR